MAQKPEIQYIGQFYIHGSEAKKLARKNEEKKVKAKTELPLHRFERVRKIHVDLLAIGSLVAAVVLLVTMVVGTLSMQSAWQELETVQQYVYELQSKNVALNTQYHAAYNLEEVRSAALAMGMIPVSEAKTMQMQVTVPQAEPEETWLDNMVWFLEGLFA